MSVRKVAVTMSATAALATAALVIPNALAGEQAGKAHQKTQAALEDLVRDKKVPGVVAAARDSQGAWSGTAGVADRETKRERLPEDRYRIGSITKTFVATVMLQLEADGKLDLDDNVDQWLPNVVRGNKNDGRKVTLRQLLNHTSGIFNYAMDPDFNEKFYGLGFLERRYDTWTPEQLVEIAMKHKPAFAPGTGWNYANTNYILAGMVIEKVTGQPYRAEVERRILKPLGLRATSVPHTDPRMPQPSSRAYSDLVDPKAGIHDVTELDPSFAGAAGEMISNSTDLQRFLRALMKGELLPAAQMKEMTKTIPIDKKTPKLRYGLGLLSQELSCGKEVWGHNGSIAGAYADMVATRDATHSLAVNINGDWVTDTQAIIEAEFCG